MTIHHATTKSATKHGLVIEPRDDTFVVVKDGTDIAVGLNAKEALAEAFNLLGIAAIARKSSKPKAKSAKKARKARKPKLDDDGEPIEDDDDEEGERSVIKAKYRERYQPHKSTCGDALAKRLRKTFHVKTDDGDRLDWPAFTKFCKANQVWVQAYDKLNAGMRRMNLINRLRARVRNGEEIVGWPEKAAS